MRAAGAEVQRVADVTDPDAPGSAGGGDRRGFGRLDILVANAGGPPPGRALEVNDDRCGAAVNANLLSSVRLVRAAVPSMQRRLGPDLLHHVVLGQAADPRPGPVQPGPDRAVGVGQDGRPRPGRRGTGITLNLICPGPHATDRMRELGGGGVMGDPADFGRVVAFLCSEHAGFVNGAAVVVDGGATLAL